MAESTSALQFESPVTSTYPSAGDAPMTLGDISSMTKLIVRAADGTAATSQMGVPFGASRLEGDVLISGQRPSEWLLLGPAPAVGALAASLDRTGHVSTIDHTHSRAMFRLTGESAASALEKVCGLDWSDAMTPNGAVVSASVAKVTCDIIRNDNKGAPSYLIACDRSFGQYLFDALLDAGAEFGIGVNN